MTRTYRPTTDEAASLGVLLIHLLAADLVEGYEPLSPYGPTLRIHTSIRLSDMERQQVAAALDAIRQVTTIGGTP